MGKRKRRKNAAKRSGARRSGSRAKPSATQHPVDQPSTPSSDEDATRDAATSTTAATDSSVESDARSTGSTTPRPRSPAPPRSSSSSSSSPSPTLVGLRDSASVPGSPRWPRLAVGASIGAALLSTAVAMYVVFREPPSASQTPLAAASPAGAPPEQPPLASPSEPESPSTAPSTPPPQEPTLPPPPGTPKVPWPDLSVDGLPPVDAAPKAMGQSLGSPRDGAMLHAAQLPESRDYLIRNQHTAWGTDNTIAHLRAAIATVRKAHPQLHRLVIGDISTRRGGPLDGHTSHQAGRDADIGLFFRGRAEDGPTTFIEATRDRLDRRATLDLIMALAKTRDEPTGVQLIVLDYNLQRILRRYAESRGISEPQLEALFQFPHGPNSRHGLIRHKPAHRDHMHVRFRCPEGDDYCRDPLIGFGGMEAPDPAGAQD